MTFEAAPLSKHFFLASILGFIISAYFIKDDTWKFTFMLIFAIMFVAAMLSFSKAPIKALFAIDKKK